MSEPSRAPPGDAPSAAADPARPQRESLTRRTFKWPFSGTEPTSFARGVGQIAGIATAAAVGLADGIVTLLRTPSGTISRHSAGLVVWHCVAVLATFGLFIGAGQELLLAAARRRPRLVAFGHFLIDGPRRWFARDARSALVVLTSAMYLALVIGPVLPFSYAVITRFHSQLLAVTAIFLFVVVMMFIAAALVAVIAWPLGCVLERAGPIANPGLAVLLCVGIIGIQTVRFVVLNFVAFRQVDAQPAFIGVAALVVDVIALWIGAAVMRRKRRPARAVTVTSVSLLALLAFAGSAMTFGNRQTVASTIFTQSRLTGTLVRVLQRVIDFDRDHYGAWFGGGDCNDRDARIHPGARDVPGNGIDENCTGADAHHEVDPGDGRMVPVVGPLAHVRPSFVFLSIDAVRPDHVGAYGYRRATTPNIDRFANDAARFTNAYSTSPRSLRSFTSIWVGRYPSLISWGLDNRNLTLLPENVTLAEQLSEAGYVSAALSNSDDFHRTRGFYQGFSEWHEPSNESKGDVWSEVAQINTFLTAHATDPRPFFMWAHIMEPHDPYRHWTEHDFGNTSVDNYDSEIARADDAVGHVLQVIDRIAARRPVVVAIFSDHGEAFGEHGYYNHSSDLHEEQARVMLLIRGPGIAPGIRRALTSLMDLNPTALNYVGRPLETPIDARSLVPVLQDPATPDVGGAWRDHLFMEVTPDGLPPGEQRGLLAPPYKLIYDVNRGSQQLYDLSRDPRELTNLVDDDTALANRMRERLWSWLDASSLPANRTDDLIARSRLTAPPTQYDVPVHVRFGDVAELLGVDLPSPRAHHNETLRLVFYYRVLRPTTESYWLHVSFEAMDGGGAGWRFEAPHYPIYGRYNTTRWIPGEILRDEVNLRIEPEVRATRYHITLKLQADNWGPILMPDNATRPGDPTTIRIAPIDVLP